MTRRLVLTLAAGAALAGCRAKEITPIDRAEAANDVSEAEFAVTLKDWPRAEGLYVKATTLCPDETDYWVNLGIVRMRLGDRSGARSAYKKALPAFDDAAAKDPSNGTVFIRKAYVLVILGRADDARSVIDRAMAKLPDDRRLKAFIDMKGVDQMVADPSLRENSP